MPQVMQRKSHLTPHCHIKAGQVINGAWRALETSLVSHTHHISVRWTQNGPHTHTHNIL